MDVVGTFPIAGLLPEQKNSSGRKLMTMRRYRSRQAQAKTILASLQKFNTTSQAVQVFQCCWSCLSLTRPWAHLGTVDPSAGSFQDQAVLHHAISGTHLAVDLCPMCRLQISGADPSIHHGFCITFPPCGKPRLADGFTCIYFPVHIFSTHIETDAPHVQLWQAAYDNQHLNITDQW